MQRVDLAKEQDFRLGGLLARPSSRQIESSAAAETLQPRIMQVLVALARQSGQVVSRDDLIESCWEGRVVGEDALNRCIQQLRKLGETHQAFRLETIPKVGYRLHPRESKATAAVPTTIEQAHHEIESQSLVVAEPTKVRHRWVFPALAALVLVFVAAGYFIFEEQEPPIVGRIAFFGIDAPSGDKDAEAVAAATSSDILSTFAALELDVAASTATAGVEPQDRIGRALELRAQYVITGATARRGDAMSVSIRVEDAKSRTALWSNDFEGNAASPSAIASRAAALLNDRLTCVSTVRSSLQTDDMRIVTRLPKACDSIRLPAPGSADRWSELVELAPDSAWLLASQAIALINASREAPSTDVAALEQRAFESLRRAEQIDPSVPEVHQARVLAARHRGASLLEQERLFLEGIEKAGNGPNLIGYYSAFLVDVGRSKEASVFGRRALALDPLSAPKMLGLAEALVRTNQPASAEQLYMERHARFPDNAEWQSHITAALFYSVGDFDAVLRDPPPSASRKTIDCVTDIVRLVRTATPSASREAARRAADCRKSGALQRAPAEHIRALLGDFEFVFIGDVVEPWRWPFYPKLTQLRADPRFSSLMEKRGLLAYWRDSGHPPDFCATEKAPVCELLTAK